MKFILAGLLLGLGAAVKFSGASVHVLGGNLSAPKEALIAMVKKASEEDGSANDATVSSLANMAENMVRMAATQAPSDMQQSITTINNLVSGMLEKVIEDSAIAWSGVKNTTGFETCTSDMYACMSQDAEEADEEYGGSSRLYDQCMSELAALEAQLEACLSAKTITDQTTAQLCAAFQAIDEKYGGIYTPEMSGGNGWQHFACVDPFAGTYREYLQRAIGWLAEWRAKKAACENTNSVTDDCTDLQLAVNTKRSECQVLQPPIPDGCKGFLHKRSCCSGYDTCWSSAESTRTQAEATANQLSINLKAQYRSLKRIECLLDVLVLEGDQTAALEACIAKTHDTSILDPVLPPAPIKASCDPGQPPEDAECSAYLPLTR